MKFNATFKYFNLYTFIKPYSHNDNQMDSGEGF